MAESTYEFSGKTVDEAVAEGLAKLGVARSDVAVEVLSKGSRGIFGLGSEAARVRITLEPTRKSSRAEAQATADVEEPAGQGAMPSPAPTSVADIPAQATTDVDEEWDAEEEDEEGDDQSKEREPDSPVTGATIEYTDEEVASMAAEMVGEIVRLMGFRAEVVTSWQDADDNEGSSYLLLDIEGDDLGALIGRRGETLASLQYLVRLMVNQRVRQWRNIVVDVEKYKERRVDQLHQLALRMADQVAESGRSVALEPMPANERRIVHLALRDHPQVYSQSSGEGDRRKVNIVPKDTA